MRRKKENKLKFISPKNEQGKEYWVPIVAKNKDYLVGYIQAYKRLSTVFDIPLDELQRSISSDRFNDILYDDSRVKNITKTELKEKLKNIMFFPDRTSNKENDERFYYQYAMTVDCPGCGIFYGYKNIEEVPEKDSKCGTCDRVLIHYTGHNDEEYEDNPANVPIEIVLKEINEEIRKGGQTQQGD